MIRKKDKKRKNCGKEKQKEIQKKEKARLEQENTRQDVEILEKRYKEAKKVEISKKKTSDKLLDEVNKRHWKITKLKMW